MKRTIFSMMALLLGTVAGCGGGTTTTPSACATVTCSGGQFCDGATGMCKTASSCASVTCSAGTVCDGSPTSTTSGMCVAQTCGTCSGGQVCNSSSATCVNPGVPALSVQIDRMGRPAINTALTNPFDIYKPTGPTGQVEPGDVTKDRYNHDAGTTAVQVTNWTAAITQHLAIFDGLLGGTCGDQIAFGSALGAQYAGLAGLLAADSLLVDTTQGTCANYLGVEAKALGGTVNDCGGRKLDYDVIDATYTVLTNGGKATPTAISDGIAQTTAPMTTFPFFTTPQ